MSDGRAEVERVTAEVRSFLEPMWDDFHRAETERREACAPGFGSSYADRGSVNMCRFSAAFLAGVLRDRTGADWRVAGGSQSIVPGTGDGGIVPRDVKPRFAGDTCRYRSHYWARAGDLVADVTADQFGYDKVVVTSADDPRFRANYTASELRRDLSRVTKTLSTWRSAYRKTHASDAADPSP